MQSVLASIFLVSSVFGLIGAANLQAKYPFSVVLFDEGDQYYGLHWNFTRSTETIYFAVNVSTTGWIGFGLSPTGQMPSSDVVIGWVSSTGESYFHDRFAEGRFLPPIDDLSQDWFLDNSIEEDGFTILEFSREFISCDPQDLDITSSATSRVLWSFSVSDPSDPTGSDAIEHDYKGSISLNLINAGQPDIRVASEDEPSFNITVTDVTIPSASTTYWCQSFRLQDEWINTAIYINKHAPFLTSHERAYVHHMTVFLCPTTLAEEYVGASQACNTLDDIPNTCRQGLVIGGWAVGGETFTYPEDIAFPLGGNGVELFAMIEMHYDNPGNTEGVVDNSGMEFFYKSEEPRLRAGALSLGHSVVPYMFIPPSAKKFTISSFCSSECTSKFIPEGGIRIFANFMHTHVVGRSLTLQHFRMNTECGVLEELEPIDQNLNYDFNYQQYVHLPKERLVLPGDILILKCEYDTSERSNMTTGGESTQEEMCLAFPLYYPRPNDENILDYCISLPDVESSFNEFYYTLLRIDRDAAARFIDPEQALDALNGLDWAGNPVLAESLESSVTNSSNIEICGTLLTDQFHYGTTGKSEVPCPYQAPDRCSSTEPLSCCERIAAADGAAQMKIPVGIAFFMLIMSLYL